MTSLTTTSSSCSTKSWLYCHQILKLADPLFTTYWLKTFNFQKWVQDGCHAYCLTCISSVASQLHNLSCSCLKMRVKPVSYTHLLAHFPRCHLFRLLITFYFKDFPPYIKLAKFCIYTFIMSPYEHLDKTCWVFFSQYDYYFMKMKLCRCAIQILLYKVVIKATWMCKIEIWKIFK